MSGLVVSVGPMCTNFTVDYYGFMIQLCAKNQLMSVDH